VYITYPLVIFGLVVLGTLLYVENRKYNELSATFDQARESLNKANTDKQITIEDLSAEFKSQTDTIANLRRENEDLKTQVSKLQQEGVATISGRILPFISSNNTNFAQFQRVCAESTANANVQYCRTVSAIQQTFDLYVEPGNYHVYAEIFPQPKDTNASLFGVKTYFTEYVKCVQDKNASECSQDKLTKPVIVAAPAGSINQNINPIDWR
jgi:hypothetical protein